jgi:Ca-activated chloride channel family protein
VPLFVLGRYRGPAGGVTVNAEDEAGTPWSAAVASAPTVGAAVRAIWARGRVRYLEDRYVIEPSRRPEIGRDRRRDITALRRLSRFTAFVAVDRNEAVNPGGNVHHIPQPVEAPDAWVLRLGPMMMPAMGRLHSRICRRDSDGRAG